MYIHYIFLILVILLFVIYAYIKIKYKFWSIQPVFHFYDLQWYLFPCGIIMHELPEKNKYCNFRDIETLQFDTVKPHQLSRFIHFIQSHYLQNKENKFLPSKENIVPYFTSHNSPCFFTFYNTDELNDTTNNGVVQDTKIISVMTSRPLHVCINNGNNDAIFDVYYVDYLCVDKGYRKRGIAPEIIQTHEYNQRLLNQKIKVSLFKREDELTGIIPLCVYKTHGFDISNWKNPPTLPIQCSLIEIGKVNFHHLMDFIKIKQTDFDIVITMEFSNLMELIKTQNIYCYVIIENGVVVSAYFFKKTCTYITNKKEALVCFASIKATKDDTIFINGYKNALCKICKKHTQYKFGFIEDISNNNIIIQNLVIKNTPFITSPTAFFFYNFAYSVFKSEKCLLLY